MANSEHISLSTFCVLPPAYRGTALWITPGFEPASIRAQEGVVNSLSRPPTAPSPRLGLKERRDVGYYTDRATGLLMLRSRLLASTKTPNLAAAWALRNSGHTSMACPEHIYIALFPGTKPFRGGLPMYCTVLLAIALQNWALPPMRWKTLAWDSIHYYYKWGKTAVAERKKKSVCMGRGCLRLPLKFFGHVHSVVSCRDVTLNLQRLLRTSKNRCSILLGAYTFESSLVAFWKFLICINSYFVQTTYLFS